MDIALNTYSLRKEFDFLGMGDDGPNIHDTMINLCNDLDIKFVEMLDKHAPTDVDKLKEVVKKYEDNSILTKFEISTMFINPNFAL